VSFYTGSLERAAGAITATSASVFAALSAVRRKRFFHPEGVTYVGTVRFTPTSLGLPFHGEAQAHVRLSKGAGTPGSFPDVLGLAIKFPELGQDLLLATSGDNVVTRHLLLPASGFFSQPYSSVLPYELANRLVVFGAHATVDPRGHNPKDAAEIAAEVRQGTMRFELTVSAVGESGSETFGSLVLERVLPGDISFNPWNCRPPLRPAGPLNRLRLDTYKASQAARPNEDLPPK
jgi:hypothetical protein